MKKKELIELVFIIDESGSMSFLREETISGFNDLIKKQIEESKETIVTLVTFNNLSKVGYDRLKITEIALLTEKNYNPSGSTALLDALGSTIKKVEEVHEKLSEEELPTKTMFFITTDGMENSSTRYRYSDIKKLISYHEEKDNWEFNLLAANIDVPTEAIRLGIKDDNAVSYCSDSLGTQQMYKKMCDKITTSRKKH